MTDLVWTSDRPKVPGWYWWMAPFGSRGICYFYGNEPSMNRYVNYQWAGPIPEPTEPTTYPTKSYE